MTTLPNVLCISLNPAIDTTIAVPILTMGAVNRAVAVDSEPAGKAINVATLLAQLKGRFGGLGQLRLLGFLGADNASEFVAKFDKFSLINQCVMVSGVTRQNIKLTCDDGTTTDVNGIGFVVGDCEKKQFFQSLTDSLPTADFVVLSGSLPKGFDLSDFETLLKILQNSGKKWAVDTSGQALQVALAYQPFLIKPNETELGEVFGIPLDGLENQLAILPKLDGIEHVVLSMGKDGVHWFTKGKLYKATTPSVVVKSTVGAGDTLLSGVIFGLLTGNDVSSALSKAVAMAAGAVSQVGFVLASEDKLAAFGEQIIVSEQSIC